LGDLSDAFSSCSSSGSYSEWWDSDWDSESKEKSYAFLERYSHPRLKFLP
jgi:hypothetical protein